MLLQVKLDMIKQTTNLLLWRDPEWLKLRKGLFLWNMKSDVAQVL